ncbi:MAG: sulfotransferase [Thermoanaerobaculia bacterium]
MTPTLRRWYRKMRYGEPVIVVSGLPRSGTSMAMKMLEAGGVPLVTDGQREADIDNPKGYFEDERVLRLAEEADKAWLRGSRGKAIKIISYLLRHLPPENNYKILFMRRDLTEVLASQAKMLERRGEPNATEDERMRQLFETDLWKAGYFMKHAAHVEALEIHYSEVLADPEGHAYRIAEFVGAELDVEKMAQVVDPDLYRNRADG